MHFLELGFIITQTHVNIAGFQILSSEKRKMSLKKRLVGKVEKERCKLTTKDKRGKSPKPNRNIHFRITLRNRCDKIAKNVAFNLRSPIMFFVFNGKNNDNYGFAFAVSRPPGPARLYLNTMLFLMLCFFLSAPSANFVSLSPKV